MKLRRGAETVETLEAMLSGARGLIPRVKRKH